MEYKWDSKILKDISNYTTGKLNSNQAVENGEYPFFTTAPETFRIDTWKFDEDAILLGGNNANGNFTIKRFKGKFNAYQRTYIITIKDNSSVNIKFLYYSLILQLNYLKSTALGSATKFLTKSILDNLEIKYPKDFSAMEKIANILSSFDDKIENNNAIIANLEEQAQTIFKSWFVNFEPFQDEEFVESELGEIPVGWSVSTLDEIADYKNGLAMQRYRPNDVKDSLPVLKIKELRANRIDVNSDRCTIHISEDVRVFDGDVIFSWSGSLLVELWTGGDAGLNQHLFKVTSKNYDKWFYYYWTKFFLERFVAIARDRATTMGHIKRSHLKEAKVLVPDEEVLNKMDAVMNPLVSYIINLGKQNKKLEEIRDTLLPKLMSGEIRIGDVTKVE